MEKLPYQYLSKIPTELPINVLFSICKLQNKTIPLRWMIPTELMSHGSWTKGKRKDLNKNPTQSSHGSNKCINFKTLPASSCMNPLTQGNLQTPHKMQLEASYCEKWEIQKKIKIKIEAPQMQEKYTYLCTPCPT